MTQEYTFENIELKPDTVLDYDTYRNTNIPIVIDNGQLAFYIHYPNHIIGSYSCRAGFSGMENPHLIFRPVVGKVRGKSGFLVGNDIHPDDYMRMNVKTPFERDVITNFDVQEQIFDYVFYKLGIDTSHVQHPILITEPICNPNYCRGKLSELLFESYRVPSICYAIDALLSYDYNTSKFGNQDGIIISSGFHSTHILPIVNGVYDIAQTKRLSIGGFQATDLLLKLLQLKYPIHREHLTVSRTEQLKNKFTCVAEDYIEHLTKLSKDPKFFNEQTKVIQLPYQQVQSDSKDESRKKKQGERLKMLAEKRKREKNQELEKELQDLETVKAMSHSNIFEKLLKDAGYENEKELDERIKKLQIRLKKTVVEEKKPLNLQLLEMKDEDLTEEQLKEKRKIKMMHGAQLSREKKKQEKEEQRAKLEELKKQDELRRKQDPEGWLKEMREKRRKLIDKINQKKRLKDDLKNRRSAASKRRLAAMAQAANQDVDDSTFGLSDEDWGVYRLFSKETDEEDELNDELLLNRLHEQIRDVEIEMGKNMEDDYYSRLMMQEHYDLYLNDKTRNQIHLTVERFRIPEILFQPSMIGMEQAGIAEILNNILSNYPPQIQQRMVNQIFICGGNTLYENFAKRIEREVMKMRPFGSPFKIFQQSSIHDAWKGGSKFASGETFKKACITRKQYDEMGFDYLIEHSYSNKYFTKKK